MISTLEADGPRFHELELVFLLVLKIMKKSTNELEHLRSQRKGQPCGRNLIEPPTVCARRPANKGILQKGCLTRHSPIYGLYATFHMWPGKPQLKH